MSHPSPRPSVSRRGVLQSAAWTAPAVTVVSAAPAFATSAVKQLSLTDAGSLFNPALRLKCTITATAQIPAQGLTVTVSCTSGGQPVTTALMPLSVAPAGWSTSGPSTSFVFTYLSALAPGQSIQLSAHLTPQEQFDIAVLAQAASFTSSGFMLGGKPAPSA